jgi:RNA polymerase sigma factor (sigma-70 family)
VLEHDPDAAPEPPPVRDHADDVDLSVDVARALLEVPEDYRVVMLLHDVHDLPYDEVAAIVGVPVGTVKSRLHRGRVALARIMGITRDRAASGEERAMGRERPTSPEPSDGATR